jgi:hypothetical protein
VLLSLIYAKANNPVYAGVGSPWLNYRFEGDSTITAIFDAISIYDYQAGGGIFFYGVDDTAAACVAI